MCAGQWWLVAGLLVLSHASRAAGQSAGATQIWLQSKVDHFNDQDSRTWAQRCLVNASAWTGTEAAPSSAPVFFYTGNEGDVESFYNNSGFLFDHAPEFAALVVFCEHRYYGQSMPLGDTNHTFNNMGYLSVAQALADFALLIPQVRSKYHAAEPSMTVAFGGSYGGMLTAWLRLKYPAVVDAGLAASAPLAFAVGAPGHPEFFTGVTQDIAAVDPQCPDLVRGAFSEILEGAKSADGRFRVWQDLNLCNPIDQSEVHHLTMWARAPFTTLAMGDYPYPTDFLGNLTGFPMRAACQHMLDARSSGKSLMTGLAKVAAMVYQGQPTGVSGHGLPAQCFQIDEEYVECADQTGCGADDGYNSMAWDYQACTEINLLIATNNKTDMFPPEAWTLANLTTYCEEGFFHVTPNPQWASTYFGGTAQDPAKAFRESASRIIFSNGLLDPWHGGGFLKDLSPDLPAVILPEGAHHLDLRGANPLDPPSTTAARAKELAYLRKWIAAGRDAPSPRRARSELALPRKIVGVASEAGRHEPIWQE